MSKMKTHQCSCGASHPWDGRPTQIIGGREVPDGPLEAAKEYVSLAVSALATARDKANPEVKTAIQDTLSELSSTQFHLSFLK